MNNQEIPSQRSFETSDSLCEKEFDLLMNLEKRYKTQKFDFSLVSLPPSKREIFFQSKFEEKIDDFDAKSYTCKVKNFKRKQIFKILHEDQIVRKIVNNMKIMSQSKNKLCWVLERKTTF